MNGNMGRRSSMRRDHARVFSHVVGGFIILGTGAAVHAQCTSPPCPTGCPTTCDVTTQAELVAALACHATTGNFCSHIRIPANVILEVGSQIEITAAHDGLHLEIIGQVTYTEEGPDERLFRLRGISGLLVDGGGTITSDEIASENPNGIAKAFAVTESSSNITIQNLTVHDLSTVIEVDSGQAVALLSVINVHATDMVFYGYFISERTDATFRNCSVNNTLFQHPFRLYTGVAPDGDLDVDNCWSYHDNPGKSGLWILQGDDARVDRFSSNQEIIFGPDPGWCLTPPPNPMPVPCASGPLTDTRARELHSTDHIQVEMGVNRCCLVNLCTPTLFLGREPQFVAHEMRLRNTNWDEFSLSGDYEIADNPDFIGPNVQPVTYNYCFADINRSNTVDVDDLVAVILAWGACAPPPTGVTEPPPPCAADIDPHICGNNAVDVDDLILVITSWGACPSHPVCGLMVTEEAETDDAVPETVEDCYDLCIEKHPDGGAAFIECYNACLEALDFIP